MDVTYIGPHNAVEIETKSHVPGTLAVLAVVKNGETVTVSDAVAKGDPKAGLGGLLDQPDNWVEAKKATAKKLD